MGRFTDLYSTGGNVAGKTSKMVNQNTECSQQCVNTVSTQGKCDTPISVACMNLEKSKNSQYTREEKATHGQIEGVKNTIASGQQKVAPLSDHNRFIWGFTSLSTLYRSYHDG